MQCEGPQGRGGSPRGDLKARGSLGVCTGKGIPKGLQRQGVPEGVGSARERGSQRGIQGQGGPRESGVCKGKWDPKGGL